MATNTDFLRFSAYSIKDLITRKLAQDSNFTDQVYEGSNLAILIDIFSYMAQCLLYSLNNAAAESMFADTQIYENMNRLVKFIGYNPKGCQPSNVLFTVTNLKTIGDIKSITIPKYSFIQTDLTDQNGQIIYFSTIEDEHIINNNKNPEILFYNGIWKKYSTVFTSNGSEYQKFILDELQSDTTQTKVVAHNLIHVYIKNNAKYDQYKSVTEGLFTDNNINNGTYIYSNDESGKIFNIRLNETKTYEIQFGNGRTGMIPPKDSEIHIFYLETNGLDPAVQIAPKTILNAKIKHSFNTQDEYKSIFINNIDDTLNKLEFQNITKATESIPEESVESIRQNAPEWFKTGNRLVTANDYKYFIKNRFSDNILDVVCQNNWQYISTFYKWLYELGLNGKYVANGMRIKNDQYYINQNRIIKYDYKYADASDSNNVYVWVKMRNDLDIYKHIIDKEVQNIKMLTQELVQLTPLTVYFSPCAADDSDALKYFENNGKFDSNNESYIELTIDDNIIYTDIDLAQQAVNIIKDFFKEDKCTLGQFVNFSELCQKIYFELNISRIRTIYKVDNEVKKIYNGISFATWTSDYIDVGDDLDISTQNKSLEVFQFPKLYNDSDLINKIKVIRKSVNVINSIQY